MLVIGRGDTEMIVSRQAFHSAKDKFTRFESYGKGETVGAKVIDALRVQSHMDGQSQVTEWFHRGQRRFRLTATPKGPGDVFPPSQYEIL
jgi:hypothetical protein